MITSEGLCLGVKNVRSSDSTRMNRCVRNAVSIALTVLLALLAGCNAARNIALKDVAFELQSGERPIRGNVEIWSWNIAAEALTHLAPEFERRNPGVRVHVNKNGDRLQSRLLLVPSSGVGAPDISQLQLVDAA